MKIFIAIVTLLFMAEAPAADAVISLNERVLNVMLAVSQDERRQGLMHREQLNPDEGMLFVYPEPRITSFWMKNTLIPLDILYFDHDGRLIQIHANLQPCIASPCQTYTNEKPAQYVLELPAGSAEKMSLTLGNRFEILKQ